MIVDLESKKLINSFECLGIGRRDSNSSTTWHLFENIVDAGMFGLHDENPRRYRIVNEHGNLKFRRCEAIYPVTRIGEVSDSWGNPRSPMLLANIRRIS